MTDLLPDFDVRLTVISQYANSPRILGLIDLFFAYLDPTPLLNELYNKLWNIDTAEGYGLDVWGRIVGVGRVLQVAQSRFFGFADATHDFDPWNQSPYYSGQGFTSNYALTDEAYRQLILAKALANITDGSIPALNRILQLLFGAQGKAYVTDPGGMAMTYTFEFQPTPVQLAILTQSGVFPRPTGVAVSIVTPP